MDMQPSRLRRRQRRRVIGNGVLAVGTLLFGIIFVADAKSVTIVVDGHRAEIRTLTDDVAALLDSTGVVVADDGVVLPGPSTPLENGMIVVVDSRRTEEPAERVTPLAADLRDKWRGALRFQHRREVAEERRREARRARIRAERQAEREAARKAAEAPGAAPARSAIARARLGSTRKFCPRRFVGRMPWRSARSRMSRRPSDG
ncbi:MAG: hypothetical protein ACKOI0_03990, partial [Actinomycetota bacterium]